MWGTASSVFGLIGAGLAVVVFREINQRHMARAALLGLADA